MLLFSSFFAAFLAAETSRPNVILILADDLGFNDMPWNNPGKGFAEQLNSSF